MDILLTYDDDAHIQKRYEVTDTAIALLMADVVVDANLALDKLNPTYKTIAEQIARKMLYDFEKKAVASGIDREQAKKLRPEKNESPLNKLMSLMLMQNASKMLENIVITIQTSNEQKITHVTYGTKRNDA